MVPLQSLDVFFSHFILIFLMDFNFNFVIFSFSVALKTSLVETEPWTSNCHSHKQGRCKGNCFISQLTLIYFSLHLFPVSIILFNFFFQLSSFTMSITFVNESFIAHWWANWLAACVHHLLMNTWNQLWCVQRNCHQNKSAAISSEHFITHGPA